MLKSEPWILASLFAIVAGWTDWRSRRIPNWLTISGFAAGVACSSWAGGWAGAKSSLLGVALGLALLLPFVLLRSLGAGDWKLVGALGAFLGPRSLLGVLFVAVLVAGLMALVLIVWKRRVGQTLKNLWRIMKAMLMLQRPDPDLSLDNPDAVKVPFGVAVAIAVVLQAVSQILGYAAVL